MKVFIADDSKIVCERLVMMLSELKEVEIIGQAYDVHEAIEGIWECRPHVVILDIRMPGGSGIEVLHHIQELEPVPIKIVLTNYSSSPYRQRCLQAGAHFFFDKSTEFEQVITVCRQLLDDSTTRGEKKGGSL